MNLSGALTWIYRRIGQMTCFTVGGFAVASVIVSSADATVPQVLVGAVLLGTGLVLRHQHLTREPR